MRRVVRVLHCVYNKGSIQSQWEKTRPGDGWAHRNPVCIGLKAAKTVHSSIGKKQGKDESTQHRPTQSITKQRNLEKLHPWQLSRCSTSAVPMDHSLEWRTIVLEVFTCIYFGAACPIFWFHLLGPNDFAVGRAFNCKLQKIFAITNIIFGIVAVFPVTKRQWLLSSAIEAHSDFHHSTISENLNWDWGTAGIESEGEEKESKNGRVELELPT